MRTPKTLLPMALLGASHRNWYDLVSDSVHEYSRSHGLDFGQVADVLAITSPRVSVSRNARLTRHYFEHGSLPNGVLPATVSALTYWEATGNIRGPKTSAFSAAIKGDHNAIVLDTWVAKALRIEQERFGVKGVRREAARRIVAVARKLGWSARDTQAAIWAGAYLSAFENPNVPVIQL